MTSFGSQAGAGGVGTTSRPIELRWHHLVMAVGNFKRQPGRRLKPSRLSHIDQPARSPEKILRLPSGLVVTRDDESSWIRLSAVLPGAGVATTTTLLAALWPDDHLIFDWRVHAAANALRINAGLRPSKSIEVGLSGAKQQQVDFADYATVRGWLRNLDFPLVTSERALYRLSQKVRSTPSRNWADYSRVIAATLAEV
jgi:hypothetical protein